MNSFKILSLSVLIFLSGCASNLTWKERITGIGDTAVAVAQFPFCRAEWETYAPASLKVAVVDEYTLLDTAFDQFIVLIQERPSMTVQEGFSKLANLGVQKLTLEQAFESLAGQTREYALGDPDDPTDDNRNPILVQCDTQVRAGWSALTDNSPLLDWVKAYGPYAKAGVQLLPLILQRDEVDGVIRAGKYAALVSGGQRNTVGGV